MSDIELAKKHFFAALDFIDASDFANAELQLRQALPFSPGSASILTNLAVVLLRQDKRSEARSFAEQATAAGADNIEAMLVLADCIIKDDDKPERALAILEKVVALDPAIAEAHSNIGLVLRKLERFPEALESLNRAVSLEPGFADAHSNRGSVLRALQRYDEALAAYDKALVLKPGLAEAWRGRGNVLAALQRHDEARDAYRRALTHNPRQLDVIVGLAHLLLAEGEIAEAVELARRAVDLEETAETKSLAAACLTSPLFGARMGDFRDLLLRALSEPWARQSEFAPACAAFLMLDDAIAGAIARAAKAWPERLPAEVLLGPAGLARIAEDRLFRTLLESAPVCTPALELFATMLRFNLLTAAQSDPDGGAAEPAFGFYCALARQCFINNYVFAQTVEESAQAQALWESLAAVLTSGADISPLSLVAAAAYAPLHTLPGAEALLDRSWPEAMQAVLTQQVAEPLEERRLRAATLALTPIGDGVSAEVRAQYEENPYPQWVKAAPPGTPKPVDAFMRAHFPKSPFVPLDRSDDADILVAGCGTGQHPIATASRFKTAELLAVDLSLASLGYAQRQARALGLDIRFAQADIMALSSIDRTFDVIEAGGVLHHLADPFAGWRVLLSLLRPRGLMLLGLYSEAARRDIVAAREFIAARGYRPTAEDIRRCRLEMFEQTPGTPLHNVTLNTDFFSLSDCRDLLFHIQEHRLTLPQIEAFLTDNGLRFLGFELDPQTLRRYAQQFPDDAAMIDLSHWHRYETENPQTFTRMYQFWVQKT